MGQPPRCLLAAKLSCPQEGQGEWRVGGRPDKTGPYPDLIRASLRRMLAARPASARPGQE